MYVLIFFNITIYHLHLEQGVNTMDIKISSKDLYTVMNDIYFKINNLDLKINKNHIL